MATTLRWTLGALAVVLLVGSNAWAQAQRQVQKRDQQVQQGQAVRQGQGQQRTALRPAQGESMADHQIATWLLLSNELEVNLAQLADKQSQNKGVKQFAEMMVQQHGDLINQLRQFAPDAPTLSVGHPGAALFNDGQRQGLAAAADQQLVEQRQTAEQGQAVPRGQQGQLAQERHGGLPITQICHQMAERTYNSIRQELSRKQGSDFDKAFIGCQIQEHVSMLDTLHVLKPYASVPLQNVIEQAIPPTQQHLTQARQIGEQLWGGGREQDQTPQRQTGNREDNDDQNDKQDK
jgi:predicted outer membrane protein